MNELTIRVACQGDFDGLRALYGHLVPDDVAVADKLQRKTFAEMLLHPGLQLLLALKDQMPVSSCTLVTVPNLTRGCAPYALIENVVTHRDWRGRGFGRQLMQVAIDQAFEGGCYKIMLLSGAANTKAHSFYKRLGFATTKTGFELRGPGYPVRGTI